MPRLSVLHSALHWSQTWLVQLIRSLPDEIESHVCCSSLGDVDASAVPNAHSLRDASRLRFVAERVARRFGVRAALRFVIRTGRAVRPTLLHSHAAPVGWANLIAAKQLGLRHIVSAYGGGDVPIPHHRRRTWSRRYQQLFREADLFLCEGPHLKEELLAIGCPETKVVVQHLGIPVEQIEFRPRTLGEGEPLRVLLCARFAERKGLCDALRAIAQVRQKVDVRATLIGDAGRTIGNFHEPREKRRILATLRECHLEDTVELLGFQPPAVVMEQAYRHHVFLSPSKTGSRGDGEGGAPVAIMEMAATGMPIVATTHADIPNVIVDERGGLLAPEGQPDELASRLLWLARHGERWLAMVKFARKRIEDHFDSRATGLGLARIYENVSRIQP